MCVCMRVCVWRAREQQMFSRSIRMASYRKSNRKNENIYTNATKYLWDLSFEMIFGIFVCMDMHALRYSSGVVTYAPYRHIDNTNNARATSATRSSGRSWKRSAWCGGDLLCVVCCVRVCVCVLCVRCVVLCCVVCCVVCYVVCMCFNVRRVMCIRRHSRCARLPPWH